MDFKKAGRPKASKEEKRDKKILLKLTVAEYDALQNKAQGFISVSDFIRTRIFYNSTFQQVQPEEFIKILKQYLDILAETKAAMSESLSEIKRHINDGDDSLKDTFSAMMEQFKWQVKVEKEIATYMQRMLKAGRKSKNISDRVLLFVFLPLTPHIASLIIRYNELPFIV